MLHRYDCSQLANSKAMNEDLTEMKTEELHSCCIDPGSIRWQARNQGCAPCKSVETQIRTAFSQWSGTTAG
jgi:hypothetical protein